MHAGHKALFFDRLDVGSLGFSLSDRALKWLDRKPPVACGCFTAATLVWTSVGLIPIEQVQTGDWVLTRSEATEQYSWQEVTHKIVTEKTAPVELTLWHESGVLETIQTTDEHPFWVVGKGWTRADALQVGHAISTGPSSSSAPYSPLAESRAILLSASFLSTRTTVYNLSVAANPNFFVGKDGVWVHNCPDLDELYNAALKIDRNGFTFAGRALQKHAARPTSLWRTTATTASQYNDEGALAVMEILTNPNTKSIISTKGNMQFIHPDGRGVQFLQDGSFYSFMN